MVSKESRSKCSASLNSKLILSFPLNSFFVVNNPIIYFRKILFSIWNRICFCLLKRHWRLKESLRNIILYVRCCAFYLASFLYRKLFCDWCFRAHQFPFDLGYICTFQLFLFMLYFCTKILSNLMPIYMCLPLACLESLPIMIY